MAKKTSEDLSKTQVLKDYYKTNPAASPKEAIAGIKQDQGIDISFALASKVKYIRKAKAGKSPATKKTGEHGAKAQAIREALGRLGRKAKAVEVLADLKGQGITASYSQVHTIRKTFFKRGRKPGSKAASPAAAAALDLKQASRGGRLLDCLGA
ncbi:MAG: hypothetical protein AB7O62_07290 [Pirellulales bacterium]